MTWVSAFSLFPLAFYVALSELFQFCALISLLGGEGKEGKAGLKINSFAKCYSLAISSHYAKPQWYSFLDQEHRHILFTVDMTCIVAEVC